MKNLAALALKVLTIGLLTTTSFANICDDPTRQNDVCYNMRHMRAQIFALGAQRDLMQLNYDYILSIAQEIKSVSKETREKISLDNHSHIIGLQAVETLSEETIALATKNNINAFKTANQIQAQCMSCHAQDRPSAGYSWSDIFKSDWSKIYEKCNSTSRNPFVCKNMHGMLAAYSQIFTSHTSGRYKYTLLEHSAAEIERIASDLYNKKVFHKGGEHILNDVIARAEQTKKLAQNQDPEALQIGYAIPQSCMQCHATQDRFIDGVLQLHQLRK